MINVNGLMKVKSNFPVMVGKGIISKKDCDKLINEIKNANAFDDLIQGGRNRINKVFRGSADINHPICCI